MKNRFEEEKIKEILDILSKESDKEVSEKGFYENDVDRLFFIFKDY